MTLPEALTLVLDCARQNLESTREAGRLEGLSDLKAEAIEVVELWMVEEQRSKAA
jgi:hypothetical protein